MATKLYTPPEIPGIKSLFIRFGIVFLLLATLTLILYFEDGLKDSQTGEHPGFWDCVYFVCITITTVGYGDIVPVSLPSRLLDAFLITPVRFVVIFIFIGTAYQLAVKQFQEEYRMKRAVDKLQDHIIVCGYGATGSAAVRELLLQGTPPDQIVVLANSELSLQDAADLGVVAVHGDASHENDLRSIAIEQAAHVLICPGRDDTAVLVALTVRDLNPKAHIVAMCHEEENKKLLGRSGADTIITPASAGGNLMAASTRHPHLAETMQDILSVGGSMRLEERKVLPDEEGKEASEIKEIAILRVYRNDNRYDIPNLPVLKKDDTIVLVSTV